MTPASIERRFLSLLDQWGVSFEDVAGLKTILTDIFKQASIDYWESLIKEWGRTGVVNEAISPIILDFSLTSPSSNNLDTSAASTQLPNYNSIGFIKVTYVVSGVTYTNTTTYWQPEDRVSSFSQPSLRYPKHDFIKDVIQVYPTTPIATKIEGQYARNYYLIDFDTSTDVPIKEINVDEIISRALTIAFKKLGSQEGFQESQIMEAKEKL